MGINEVGWGGKIGIGLGGFGNGLEQDCGDLGLG